MGLSIWAALSETFFSQTQSIENDEESDQNLHLHYYVAMYHYFLSLNSKYTITVNSEIFENLLFANSLKKTFVSLKFRKKDMIYLYQ